MVEIPLLFVYIFGGVFFSNYIVLRNYNATGEKESTSTMAILFILWLPIFLVMAFQYMQQNK